MVAEAAVPYLENSAIVAEKDAAQAENPASLHPDDKATYTLSRIIMANPKSTTSGSKPSNSADAAKPYTDEPVPTYETALREGAGGGVAAGPSTAASSSSAPSAQPTSTAAQPSYGCSPYTPHGTARIMIVPAPLCHHPRHFTHLQSGAPAPGQPLLPVPVSMETASVRKAGPRFMLALLHAFMIYLLINLLVDLTVTRKW